MNRRILACLFLSFALAILGACGNGIDKLPGTTGGALSVQFAQGPPTPTIAGQAVGLVANAVNDPKNGGVTWSCTPVGACGTFDPATTAYNVDTQYTPPVAPTNSAITPNLSYSVTITATSVSDSTQSVSTTINVAQQYAFVLEGNGSLGMAGSVTLDGSGNIVGGEADGSANGFYTTIPSITGTYALDSSGHGYISMSLNGTSCCGTLQQTHGITATSNSHLVIAEEDQFNGLTIGGVGSMDLQTAPYSASQVSGGYSFTLAGYSGAFGENSSWGGIFTADGVGALSGGVFDENYGGGSGYGSVPFTGTFSAPDTNGRGTLTLSATTDTPTKATQYAYYIVTPEVLRLTTVTNTGNAGNTGSAFGQGTVGTTNQAVTGNFIFSNFGFTSNNNGGESGAAGGQFTSDGSGHITAGIMDVNAFGTVSTSSLAGSTYVISGSPRGVVTASSGQTYNVYLTDPNLNLLDPNNPSGGGGALLLETDAADTIGVVVPQTDTSASPTGANAILLSDQSNTGGCCNYDGGLTGQFTVSSSNAGTFSGEGDFQGQGQNSATLIVGPLSGTFTADGANPGRFTGSITTAPAFPTAPVGSTTPGTEDVSYYMANSSEGFIVETDFIAPVFGLVQSQGTVQSNVEKRGVRLSRSSNAPSRPSTEASKQIQLRRRSR
ncbi:MAG TPA: hypothetical protein VMG31_03495 [Verrucomicrobiae bacterium]|nr:hypothetical protein [Verrucomicrobiae bacterium]